MISKIYIVYKFSCYDDSIIDNVFSTYELAYKYISDIVEAYCDSDKEYHYDTESRENMKELYIREYDVVC